MLRRFAVAAMAACLALPALAGSGDREGTMTSVPIMAPFGFTWGQAADEIRNLGVTLSPESGSEERYHGIAVLYRVANPPLRPGTGYDAIYVLVSEMHGLQKVMFHGERIRDDLYGHEGTAAYRGIRRVLAEKYGPPGTRLEWTDRKVFKESDEFYQCLAYDGCGAWIASWENENGAIASVELRGVRRGEGWINLVYEGPLFDEVFSDIKRARSQKDSKAF